METAKRLGDARSHGFVEAIPVPPKVAAKAPLYFKKGIDDAESEWAQHHAKRWIDTSAKVRSHGAVLECSVHEGLPLFIHPTG